LGAGRQRCGNQDPDILRRQRGAPHGGLAEDQLANGDVAESFASFCALPILGVSEFLAVTSLEY
jgi:hypothetical protein